jgi:hypothetical protein
MRHSLIGVCVVGNGPAGASRLEPQRKAAQGVASQRMTTSPTMTRRFPLDDSAESRGLFTAAKVALENEALLTTR